MRLKLLADECIDFRLVVALRKENFEVVSVLQEAQGISDKKVLELASEHGY